MKTSEWVGHKESQGIWDCENVTTAPLGARVTRSGAEKSLRLFVANVRS